MEAGGEHILVAEDDSDISELIIALLSRESYVVSGARSIAEVRAAMRQDPVDLLVLDLGLPDGDGIDLCRALRAEGYDGAIIMVTAREGPVDRVLGLEFGADDYLTKPFEPRELLARVRNLFKRVRGVSHSQRATPNVARFGPWQLDLRLRRLVAPSGRIVMLSAAEYRLLRRFLESPDVVLSRQELLPERIATVAFDRSIDLQISRLRQKLASEEGGAEVILTVRAEGYLMPGPVRFE